MTTFLIAEELLTIAERRATSARPAVIGEISSSDLADFRHFVRYAAMGAVVHVPALMAQTDHFLCVGELQDGTRLYQDLSHPGVDASDWDRVAA